MAGIADVSARELINRLLRRLTVLTEPGDRPVPQRLALIAEINEARPHPLTVPYPATRADLNAAAETIRDLNRLRSKETSAHTIVILVLLGWLSQSTGLPQDQLITRLALTIDSTLPPDERPTQSQPDNDQRWGAASASDSASAAGAEPPSDSRRGSRLPPARGGSPSTDAPNRGGGA